MVTALRRIYLKGGENAMKVSKISVEEAQKLLESAPVRRVGEYDKIIEAVKKDKMPRLIEGLTRGQAWGLIRKCKQAGVNARALEHGTKVLVSP
jgi:hypothetical protein